LYRVITIAPIIAFLKQKHKQPFLIVLVEITITLLCAKRSEEVLL
jgi:hypothetical protein